MPEAVIDNLDQYGIISDVDGQSMALNAWTNGRNVRFRRGRVEKITGDVQVLLPAQEELVKGGFGPGFGPGFGHGLVSVHQPQWLLHFGQSVDSVWVYSAKQPDAQTSELFAITRGTHRNLTRPSGAYTLSDGRLWSSTELGGIIALTNGNDVPQIWTPAADGKYSNHFVDLPNWPNYTTGELPENNPGGERLRCNILIAYNFHLVAMNLTDLNVTGGHYPQRIRWSHPAEPGRLPRTWNIADPTSLAGEFDIGEIDSGEIVTAALLRDTLYIYKERSVWVMRHVGGNQIFSLQPVYSSFGAAAAGCVTPFSTQGGEFHAVFVGNDVLIHDGRAITKRVIGRAGDRLRQTLNEEFFERSFIVHNEVEEELWVCYPENANEFPSVALIWNYRLDTISYRDLPQGLSWISSGVIAPSRGVDEWDGESELTWDGESELTWEGRLERFVTRRLVGCVPEQHIFVGFDEPDVYTSLGQPYASWVERVGLNPSRINQNDLGRLEAYATKHISQFRSYMPHPGNAQFWLGRSANYSREEYFPCVRGGGSGDVIYARPQSGTSFSLFVGDADPNYVLGRTDEPVTSLRPKDAFWSMSALGFDIEASGAGLFYAPSPSEGI